jgi:hypothetical protein
MFGLLQNLPWQDCDQNQLEGAGATMSLLYDVVREEGSGRKAWKVRLECGAISVVH